MSNEKKYKRFTYSDRFEHWTQMAAFATLGLTGLIQRYASTPIALSIISALGGIETVRIIHRIASIGLMLGVIYHFGAVGYKVYVKRRAPKMFPGLLDIRAAWETLLFNLGRKKTRPQQGRYTFDEKFEYWAFVWGTLVMGLTGFMLWNPIVTTRLLPGDIIPAAKTAHSLEAVLAVVAILIWHFYNVHIKHLNKSMFTGYLSEKEMLEEHPIELADIKAGEAAYPPDPNEAKRRNIFFPIYMVVAVILSLGAYAFVTMEDTALRTIPPAENVEVFVPLTPTPLPTPLPTPTPVPVAAVTWNDGIGSIFETKCGACHGQLGGLDLSNYESAMRGGNSGQAIIPGDPDNSPLVTLQEAGGHPGEFSADEIQLIREWITARAPQE